MQCAHGPPSVHGFGPIRNRKRDASRRSVEGLSGTGGTVGDTALAATTGDAERASLYATKTAKGGLVLVAVNKSAQVVPAVVKLTRCPAG